ncbi:MAG: TadE/TadG family type IV pilus assembly protein [Rhodanobacter sp.]
MALEFALVFLLGVLPLMLLTVSGVMIFAAKQSLTLAAAEGARAALRYGTTGSIAEREVSACQAAQRAMQWLLAFSGEAPDCNAPADAPPIAVAAVDCPSGGAQCVRVVTTFDYDAHPFIPGTVAVYGWVIGKTISSSATVQLDGTGA